MEEGRDRETQKYRIMNQRGARDKESLTKEMMFVLPLKNNP